MSLGTSVLLETQSFHKQQGQHWAEPSVYGKGIYIAENFHMSTQLRHSGIPIMLPARKSAPQYWYSGERMKKDPEYIRALAIHQCVSDFWPAGLQHTAILLSSNVWVRSTFMLDVLYSGGGGDKTPDHLIKHRQEKGKLIISKCAVWHMPMTAIPLR